MTKRAATGKAKASPTNKGKIAKQKKAKRTTARMTGLLPGTAIDDTATLRKLATCLQRSPDLDVAAALSKIGVTDRAARRRISSKYRKQAASSLLRNKTKLKSSVTNRGKADNFAKSVAREMAAQPLLSETPAVKRGQLPLKETVAKPGSKTAKTEADHRHKFAHERRIARAKEGAKPHSTIPWLGTGLDLTTAAFRTQLELYEQMMKMAPMKTILQQQAQFSQAMLSLFSAPLLGSMKNMTKSPPRRS